MNCFNKDSENAKSLKRVCERVNSICISLMGISAVDTEIEEIISDTGMAYYCMYSELCNRKREHSMRGMRQIKTPT